MKYVDESLNDRLLFGAGKQTEFLANTEQKFGSRCKIIAFLGVKLKTYEGWRKEKCTLPLSVFYSVCIQFPELASFGKFITERLPPNWGRIKGGKKRAQKIDMCAVRKAKSAKRIDAKRTSAPPSENDAINTIKNADLHAVLATCLITDGSVELKNKRMTFASKNQTLSDLVYWLFYKLSRYEPTRCVDKHGIEHVSLWDRTLTNELLELTPSFKTSPNKNQSPKQYLAEPQPTINFLKCSDRHTIISCMRTALSTDGSMTFDSKGRGELALRCSHPSLCREWAELLSSCGLRVRVKKDKNSWSGAGGVFAYDRKSLGLFWRMGGFLPGVLVSGKSDKFNGLTKNEVLEMYVGPGPYAEQLPGSSVGQSARLIWNT